MLDEEMVILDESELEEIAGGITTGKYINYTVVKGDSLIKIAKKFGTTYKKIYALNKDLIKDPRLIQIGWVLKIPQ